MALVKFGRFFLALILFHQVLCLVDIDSEKKCKIKVHLNSDAIWQQVTQTTQLTANTKSLNVIVCCEGYVDNETPVCNRKCPSGHCLSGFCPPDEENPNCKCYYSRHIPYENFKCQPLCQPNKNCSGEESCKDNCTCHSGYTKDNRTNLCVPTECFHRCSQGICDQRGACMFNGNHQEYTNGSLCFKSCLNGLCDSDGNCVCNEGFKSVNNLSCRKISCPSTDHKDEMYCKTQCEVQCMNGNCSQDGMCICPGGHYLKDSKCVSLCKDESSNGNCTFFNECMCKEGYVCVNGSCVVDKSVLNDLQLSWICGGVVFGVFIAVVVVMVLFKKTRKLLRNDGNTVT